MKIIDLSGIDDRIGFSWKEIEINMCENTTGNNLGDDGMIVLSYGLEKNTSLRRLKLGSNSTMRRTM